LRKRIAEYKEPKSVQILKTKTDKEKEYLQKTIIMMELKQLAESISMVGYRRKIKGDPKSYQFKNRPLLWAERIQQQNT
jgi:hypothetical protein